MTVNPQKSNACGHKRMQVRRLHAQTVGKLTTLCNARGTNTRRIGSTGVRDAVSELGQGLDLALLVAGCQEQTSGGPGLTRRGYARSSYSITNGKRPGGHLRYLRAKHPEMGGGNVHHVQVVSCLAIPVSPPGRTKSRRCHMIYYSARRAKGPLPPGKGPELTTLHSPRGGNIQPHRHRGVLITNMLRH